MSLIAATWRMGRPAAMTFGAFALVGCTSDGSATVVVSAAPDAPDVTRFGPSNTVFSPVSPPVAPTPAHVPAPAPLWTPPWDADVPDVACSPDATDPAVDAAGGCDFPPSQCTPGAEAGTEYAGTHWLTYFTNAACVEGTCRWETKHLHCPNGCVQGRCMAILGTTPAVP